MLFLSCIIALLQGNRRFKTAGRWKYRDMQDEEQRGGGKGREGWEENILTNSNSILSRPSWRAQQTVFPSNLILHRLLYDFLPHQQCMETWPSTSWLRKFSRPWSVFLNYQRKIEFCSAWCNTITYTLLYIYSMEITKSCQVNYRNTLKTIWWIKTFYFHCT